MNDKSPLLGHVPQLSVPAVPGLFYSLCVDESMDTAAPVPLMGGIMDPQQWTAAMERIRVCNNDKSYGKRIILMVLVLMLIISGYVVSLIAVISMDDGPDGLIAVPIIVIVGGMIGWVAAFFVMNKRHLAAVRQGLMEAIAKENKDVFEPAGLWLQLDSNRIPGGKFLLHRINVHRCGGTAQ